MISSSSKYQITIIIGLTVVCPRFKPGLFTS